MRHFRDTLEIILKILEVIYDHKEITRFKIIAKANLSSATAQQFLEELIKSELLIKEEKVIKKIKRTFYLINDKGIEMMLAIRRVTSLAK